MTVTPPSSAVGLRIESYRRLDTLSQDFVGVLTPSTEIQG
jgi:hypothetical protein